MLVLIDEAHGTFYSFSKQCPVSAIKAGADVIASSMHKTGGSLTQSSILFTCGKRVDQDRVRSTLNMLHTTSPSSLFLASLDAARKTMYFHGEELIKKTIMLYDLVEKRVNEKCQYIHVLTDDYFHQIGVFAHDHTKLVISVKELGQSGKMIYDILKDEYNIQAELGEMYVVLFTFAIGNDERDANELIDALIDIDKKYKVEVEQLEFPIKYIFPKMFVRPREAFHKAKKYVNYLDSEGEIAGESIMIYPPGIPLIIPGEKIDKNTVELIKHYYAINALVLKASPSTSIKVLNTKEKNN
jgi:lysine decarboxylase